MTEVSCKNVEQRCWIADKQLVSDVIMSDVTSISDVKNAFSTKLCSNEVVPVKSPVDEPLHQVKSSARDERCAERVRDTTSEPCGVNNADSVIERSVWDLQSTRSFIAFAEWVHDATLEPSIATLASYVDMITRLQRDVPDERATH